MTPRKKIMTNETPRNPFKKKINEVKTIAEENKETKDAKRDIKEILKANKDNIDEMKKVNEDATDRMERQMVAIARMIGGEIQKGFAAMKESNDKEEQIMNIQPVGTLKKL